MGGKGRGGSVSWGGSGEVLDKMMTLMGFAGDRGIRRGLARVEWVEGRWLEVIRGGIGWHGGL